MLNKNELSDMLKNLREEHKVPAIQLGIIKDGEIVFSGGAGFRDFDRKVEADENTLFAIGSATKAFTAESIAILVDEGKIEWDKPVKYYIPEFEMYDSYVTQNLTVRDMLSHRCGLPRHDLMWYLEMKGSTFKELMPALKYLKPSAPFRYKMQYQNHMFGLAGYLIERVSGQKWSEFVHDRILVPLGMNNTNFTVEDTKKAHNKALPYMIADLTVKEIPFKNIDVCGSAGSINSSVKDMLKWVQFNLDKGQWGDKIIISGKNIEECHTPQMIIGDGMFPWKFNEIEFPNYGFGWFIESYKGHKVIHHGGSIDGFISLVSFIPEINAGFVILSNGDGNRTPNIIQYSLYDMLFDSNRIDWNERFKAVMSKVKSDSIEQINKIRSSSPKNTQLSFELQNYCGEFENSGYGKIFITVKDDKLVLKAGEMEATLEHLCFDSFTFELKSLPIAIPLKYNIDITGKIVGLEIDFEPSINEMVKFAKIS